MAKNKNIVSEFTVHVNGEDIEVIRIPLDSNGNPRYVVHFRDLGIELDDYGKIPGLTRYRAKWYGGGYVFQSYNIQKDLEHAVSVVKDFYRPVESGRGVRPMNLLEKLEALDGRLYVSLLDDDLQEELKAYILNYCEESFATEDETLQAVEDALNSRISDILHVLRED